MADIYKHCMVQLKNYRKSKRVKALFVCFGHTIHGFGDFKLSYLNAGDIDMFVYLFIDFQGLGTHCLTKSHIYDNNSFFVLNHSVIY